MPVLANGNIRTLQDVHACLAYTGAAGVLSAESLLEDPALFSAPCPGAPAACSIGFQGAAAAMLPQQRPPWARLRVAHWLWGAGGMLPSAVLLPCLWPPCTPAPAKAAAAD